MLIRRAYRTELDPNQEERGAFLKHAGTARYAYNWGLAKQQETYEATGKRLSLGDLKKLWHQEKPAWVAEVSTYCGQSALDDLDRAYQHFFRRLKSGDKSRGADYGFPKFKSKKRGIGGFRLYGDIHIHDGAIQLPRIGRVRLKEKGYLPVQGVKILYAAVKERAGRWFVILCAEQEIADPQPVNAEIVGVDLGIKTLATLSDGTVFENPKPLKRAQRKLKRLQRAVSRKVKGSRNRQKAKARLVKAHYRVANIRSNAIHQATTAITKRYGVVAVEDLNVKGLLKNHTLAEAISDAAFGEFRRQLTYKLAWRGGRLEVVDRFYPSSKTCSACGARKPDLKLSDRVFRCGCGFVADRDLNAAINLKNVAGRTPETLNACGGEMLQGLAPVLPVEAGTQRSVGGEVQLAFIF